MRAAVFGPSPGRCMNSTTSGGTCALRLVSASISPVSTIWTIFSSIVLPIPGSSFARPSSASCAIEPRVLAHPLRRPAVGDHAERRLARQLEQVGEELELVGDVTVARQCLGHASDHRVVKATICLPTYNEAENLEPMLRALEAARTCACS